MAIMRLEEYRKHIEKDAALERRFQTIMVDPPSVNETIEILKGLRDRYEAHHKVEITDDALEAASKLSDRYIAGRFLPDKAIDLMDEAGAKARLSIMTAPKEVKDMEQEIENIHKEKDSEGQNGKDISGEGVYIAEGPDGDALQAAEYPANRPHQI